MMVLSVASTKTFLCSVFSETSYLLMKKPFGNFFWTSAAVRSCLFAVTWVLSSLWYYLLFDLKDSKKTLLDSLSWYEWRWRALDKNIVKVNDFGCHLKTVFFLIHFFTTLSPLQQYTHQHLLKTWNLISLPIKQQILASMWRQLSKEQPLLSGSKSAEGNWQDRILWSEHCHRDIAVCV